MSVFTTVSRPELERFLDEYDLGSLREFEGIAAGIENTNYFVATEKERMVLTVFEKLGRAEIPFFLELKAYLADRGFPCAHPLQRRAGGYLGSIQGKPAALVRRLYGHSVTEPEVAHCREVGIALGRLHLLGAGFPRRRDNDRGPLWWREAAHRLTGHLPGTLDEMLREELRFQSLYRFSDLPRGLIHADLFRDNALFEGEHLTGVIDFYYACTDTLLFDVAVAVNDWCSDEGGSLVIDRARALCSGYLSQRQPSPIEYGAWPAMLRAAALRFWLSRLEDLYFPRPGEITHTKDPAVFQRILSQRRADPGALRQLWSATN